MRREQEVTTGHYARLCELLMGRKCDPAGYRLHLFMRDLYPEVEAGSVGMFEESWFIGYAPQVVDLSKWIGPRDMYGILAIEAPAPHVFRADVSNYAHPLEGYFITDHQGELAWAVKFDQRGTVTPGEELKVTPRFIINPFT